MDTDTIAAIATGLSNAGIGIVRVSGKNAIGIVDRIFESKKENFRLVNAKTHTIHYGVILEESSDCMDSCPEILPKNRVDSVRENSFEDICEENFFNDNLKQSNKTGMEKNIIQRNTMTKKTKAILDEVLVSVMRAPNSYTKEDVVEINCHGGIVATRKILEAVMKMGARLAEPGEFTKRAFLNGRIDLSQAEAVIDIIHAKNEMALKNSVRQLRGDMYVQIAELREQILLDVAFIEAALDDPEHISLDGFSEKLENNVLQYLGKIRKLLKTTENGRMIKEGIKTVILGKPNVGKSSLLNLLLGENRAIVTDVEGTTRDTLQENILLNGISLNIVDTAGIRWTEDPVERIGVDKAKKEAEDADLILFVIDSSKALDENDIDILKSVGMRKMLVLLNKSDLEPIVSEQDIISLVNGEDLEGEEIDAGREIITEKEIIRTSTKEQIGLKELEEKITELFFAGGLTYNDEIYVTNARHKAALQEAENSLQQVLDSIQMNMPEDFYSIDLMNAYKELGGIIGEEVNEDLVDTIFKEFCMGK